MAHPSIRGRGAAHNPANRFDRIAVEREDWVEAEDPGPETQFFRDATRGIIARNDSPDVGFDASVNPYRGCDRGCTYCVHGEIKILMGDGTTRQMADLQPGDEIYGTVHDGRFRKLIRTRVLARWETQKPAYRITLDDGTELVASGDHRFLTPGGWKHAASKRGGSNHRRWHLAAGEVIVGLGGVALPPRVTPEYRRGYLCGMVRGDGMLRSYQYERAGRAHGNQHHFRLVLADEAALHRTATFLLFFGVATHSFVFQREAIRRKRLLGIRSHAFHSVQRIREIISWPLNPTPDWSCGFLAGIFDAEGTYRASSLRIANTDLAIIREVANALRRLGFELSFDPPREQGRNPLHFVRIVGGLTEHLRFLQIVDPAIDRKRELQGKALPNAARRRIVWIEPVGRTTLYDVTTGTGDFLANGCVAHNCFARPGHEYFGLSAGLDFETKIFVKEDAPELLRKELSSAKWRPQVLVMSGVTDPYQSVEKRLRITRRCLEVLAEFRNPVAMVTKSHLITRDADLLAELAGHRAAVANLSITTLRNDIQRVMEPRAATPERRLDALRRLADAGVPCGVMVAPVIPGLTDHEMPAILEAAAEAGAVRAGYIMLRLPYAVKDLFADWLGRHFPDRKKKVLNRLLDLRGGGLYDARYGVRMRGEGPFAAQVEQVFEVACGRYGLNQVPVALSTDAFRRPEPATGEAPPQLSLF